MAMPSYGDTITWPCHHVVTHSQSHMGTYSDGHISATDGYTLCRSWRCWTSTMLHECAQRKKPRGQHHLEHAGPNNRMRHWTHVCMPSCATLCICTCTCTYTCPPTVHMPSHCAHALPLCTCPPVRVCTRCSHAPRAPCTLCYSWCCVR